MMAYPDELTCDMAETYGVFDIKRLPVRLAGTLAAGLRENSRVKMALTGTQAEDNTFLLATIADVLRWFQWSFSDGATEENRPESLAQYYHNGKKFEEPKKKEREFETFRTPAGFRKRWEETTGRDLRGNKLKE